MKVRCWGLRHWDHNNAPSTPFNTKETKAGQNENPGGTLLDCKLVLLDTELQEEEHLFFTEMRQSLCPKQILPQQKPKRDQTIHRCARNVTENSQTAQNPSKLCPDFFQSNRCLGGYAPPPQYGPTYSHTLNVRKIMQNATFPEPGHMWTCSGDQIGKPFNVILGNFGATSTHNQPQSAVRTIFGHFEPFSSHLRPIGLIFCAIFSHL